MRATYLWTGVGRRCLVALGFATALAACGGASPVAATTDAHTVEPPTLAGERTVRLFFAGDLMLGRGVSAVVVNDPTSLFEGIRMNVAAADLAVANLESAVGDPSSTNPLRLVADPSAMALAAAAGFDGFAVANNHAGDGGADSVGVTRRHIESRGMFAVGIVEHTQTPQSPVIVERHGLRIAMLAFDLTRQGPEANASAGIAHWDASIAETAVREAVQRADVVTVSLHGGVEYLPQPDAALERAVRSVAEWGADVVWAHGAHVAYDVVVTDPDGNGRRTVSAYGLGNFLFDQRIAGTERGLVLEVLVAGGGVRAYRVGTVEHHDLRVSAPTWRVPVGNAAHVDGGWWNLAVAAGLPEVPGPSLDHFTGLGTVEAAAFGDVDGDGVSDVVVAFRRPYRPTLVNQRFSDRAWTDTDGLTAHMGIYTPADLQERWVAGTLPRPIIAVQVCNTGMAVGYEDIDDSSARAGGVWQWHGFGFIVAPDLEGAGTPTCLDVDLDGATDPVLLRDGS